MRTFPKQLAEFRRMVNARGAELRTRSREELVEAARQPVEGVEVQDWHATVGVIVEAKDDGSLCVVVQGFMASRLIPRVSSVALDGFYQRPDGSIEPMPDEEFYKFD